MARGSRAGTQREHAVRKLLIAEGWIAFRAPASLGVADVVALRERITWSGHGSRVELHCGVCARVHSGEASASLHELSLAEARLIEVKSTARGPYEHFGPADREELRAAAKQAGARAELAWWPPHGKLQWIPEDLWPT